MRESESTGAMRADAEAAAPLVSLIIVHFRTPDVLAACLDSIAAARLVAAHEVLVIDNAPVDDRAERLCEGRPGVVYVRNEKNVGFGRAVNQGLRAGRGEFLLVLNPDVEVRAGSVERLIEQMERDPSAGLVAPKLLYPDGTLQHSCRTFYTLPVFLLRRTFLGRLFPRHPKLRAHLMLDYDHETTRPVDWCLGASLLARRRAVEDVGPMDERFFLYFEDVDWCYRMQARGWRVLYHPESVMVHRYERASARRPGKGLLIHLASTLRYYEKWSFLLYWLKLRSTAIRRAVLILSDLIAVNAAFVLAYAIRNLSGPFFSKPMFGLNRYTRLLLFTDAVALLSLAFAGMYRARRREEAGEQVLGATRAMVMTALVTMASTFLFPSPVYSRLVVGLFLPLCLLLILLFRWGIFHAQGSVRSRRMHLRRVGLLAPEKDADLLRARSAEHEEYGFEILPLPPGAAVLRGREGGLQEAVFAWTQEERIAEVVLFEDWPGGETAPLIHRLARAGIPVRLVPRARDAIEAGTRMGDFLGFPALSVAGAHPAVRSWEKRAVDGALAIVSILLLGIPYLLVRLWLFATRRPIEKHEWIGRGGEVLRTGRLPGRWPRGAFFTGLRDFPRLGRWLVGQWSLVGIHPFEASIWPDLPETYRRFPPDAPPGWITLADRHGSRSAEQICAANREYVGRWSLALDIDLVIERLRGRKESP